MRRLKTRYTVWAPPGFHWVGRELVPEPEDQLPPPSAYRRFKRTYQQALALVRAVQQRHPELPVCVERCDLRRELDGWLIWWIRAGYEFIGPPPKLQRYPTR